MDVSCDKCGTEFEFDAARVPDGGLSVKCSECGHVFRAYREDDVSAGGDEWMVRQTNGNLFKFKELTTLQRWIVEKKVNRNDEISKTGRNWKRLGDIAELATFFQVVDQAAPAPRQTRSAPPPAAAPPPVAASPVAHPATVPAPAPMTPTKMGPAFPGQNVPNVGTNPQGAAWENTPQPAPQARPTGNWGMAELEPPSNDGFINDNSGYADPALGMGDDDLDDYYDQPRGGRGKWVFLFLLLGLGGAGAWIYTTQPPWAKPYLDQILGTGVPKLAESHVTTGYAELHKDTYAAIDKAIENFEKAIALADNYADANAGLAEAEIARAEYLADEANRIEKAIDPEADEEQTAPKKEDVASKRKEAEERSQRAFEASKNAIKLEPAGLRSNRAAADYYRFKQAKDQMQPMIEAAKKAGPTDARVAYVIGSSYAADPAASERAIRYFDTALEAAPELLRARYKLARVYAAQENKEKALLHVNMVLEQQADHEAAQALKLELEPPPPVAEPVKKEPMTFAKMLRQAERLRQSDRASAALRMFERALDMEPADPDVHTGMGWCYIDLEEPNPAVMSFKRALEIAPRLTDAHMGLAEAYRMKGMKRDAVKHYRKYLDILPNGPDAAVARRMLKTLQ